MQQESNFSKDLLHYIDMMMTVWPTLKSSLQNISEFGKPHQDSYLPIRQYKTMSEEEFKRTLVEDLHTFIMNHDVNEECLEDYLTDILHLMLIDEECISANSQVGGVRHMSRELNQVVHELEEGITKSLDKFEEEIYQPVLEMGGVGGAVKQGYSDSQSSDSEADQREYDGKDDWDDCSEQQDQNEKELRKRSEEQKKEKEKELQDDGWIIVKKK